MQYQARWLVEIGGFRLSETIIVSWIIMFVLCLASYLLTRNLKEVPETKRQVFLEFAYTKLETLVRETMGERFVKDRPSIVAYIGTLFLFFLSSDWMGLFGLRSPTTDLNSTVGWVTITLILIYSMGVKYKRSEFFKGFLEPSPLMLPLNLIGELARPISLSFRPFGNILGGAIIMSLVYKLLAYISSLIPGLKIPIGQLLIPVPLNLYFDLFAGTLQAFIFVMLTMVFVADAAGTTD